MRDFAGDIVDQRYRVDQKLAVGGFGTIYRATDMAIGRPVALKILHRELARDRNVVARFRRETAALAKLKSPHTLTLYDVGTTNDTLYFVMELLRGESLYDVFERTGPLPWRRVANIARGVCASLREAHALGIVHRDLKPANIFLERHGVDVDYVKVLDFGIAKVLESAPSNMDSSDLTRHGQMIGTFDYMAPEQMLASRTTAASDLFTLGVVLYEMISGQRPFGDAREPAQMLMALMTRPPTPLTGVPAELARVIMHCLSREPIDRPTVEQLDAVLASVLDVEDARFDDAEETTMIAAQPPRPRASSPVVYASAPSAPHAPRRRSAVIDSESAAVARGSLAATPALDRAHVGGGASRSRDSIPSVLIARELSEPMPAAQVAPIAPVRMPKATPMHGSIAAQSMFADPMPSPYAPTGRLSHEALCQTMDIRPSQQPTVIARGSELALPQVVPVARPREINVRFHGPETGAQPLDPGTFGGPAPLPAQKAQALRIASDVVRLPTAPPSRTLETVRWLTIALCLFGLGFLGALVIWTL